MYNDLGFLATPAWASMRWKDAIVKYSTGFSYDLS
jgi:hypothetical protein